jgi:hypothetical protein
VWCRARVPVVGAGSAAEEACHDPPDVFPVDWFQSVGEEHVVCSAEEGECQHVGVGAGCGEAAESPFGCEVGGEAFWMSSKTGSPPEGVWRRCCIE